MFSFKALDEAVEVIPNHRIFHGLQKPKFPEFTLQRCIWIRLRLLLLLRRGRRGCAVGQHLDESTDELWRRILFGRLHRHALRRRHLLRDPHVVYRGCLPWTVWSAETLVSQSSNIKITLSFWDPNSLHSLSPNNFFHKFDLLNLKGNIIQFTNGL